MGHPEALRALASRAVEVGKAAVSLGTSEHGAVISIIIHRQGPASRPHEAAFFHAATHVVLGAIKWGGCCATQWLQP